MNDCDAPLKSRNELAQKFHGVCIELGVARGVFSDIILTNLNVRLLYSIDRWADHHDVKEYMQAATLLARSGFRSIVLRADFDEVLPLFADASIDCIYLDAYAHLGQGGGKYLDDWWPKIKPGGIFSGHDYSASRFPKTFEMVNQFVARHGLEISTTKEVILPSWFVRKPALDVEAAKG